MLDKKEFDRQMIKFQTEFKGRYGEVRERLIYCSLNKATPMQLATSMLKALKRYNYDDLPTANNLMAIMYTMYPETAKDDDVFKFKLKSVS